MKKLYQASGSWNIIYLALFYISTTLAILFTYLAIHSQRWISFKVDFVHRKVLNWSSAWGKGFLIFLAIFFIVNTLYLIRKRG